MPISYEHKIIFIHIPKAAGTSIEYALGMHGGIHNIGKVRQRRQKRDYHHLFGRGLQHLTLTGVEHMLKSLHFVNYNRFGRGKHILDKVLNAVGIQRSSTVNAYYSGALKSYFKFAVVRNPYDRLVSHYAWLSGIWDEKKSPNKDGFSSFVDKIYSEKLHENGAAHDGHLTPQNEFVMLENVIGIDRVLYFEDLQNEFSRLCDELDISVKLPKRMVSGHKKYEEYYDEEIKKKVYHIYQKDFELFGYSRL